MCPEINSNRGDPVEFSSSQFSRNDQIELLCSFQLPSESRKVREISGRELFERRADTGPHLSEIFKLAVGATRDLHAPLKSRLQVRDFLLRTALDADPERAPVSAGTSAVLSFYLSRYSDVVSESAFKVLSNIFKVRSEVVFPLFLHELGGVSGRVVTYRESAIVEGLIEDDSIRKIHQSLSKSIMYVRGLSDDANSTIRVNLQREWVRFIDLLAFCPEEVCRLNLDFISRVSAFVVCDRDPYEKDFAYKQGVQLLASVVEAFGAIRGQKRSSFVDKQNIALSVLMYEYGHASRLASEGESVRLENFCKANEAYDIVSEIVPD